MDWKAYVRQQCRDLSDDPARAEDIVEELAQHLADRYAEALTAGAGEAEAFERTRAELNDPTGLAREIRRSDLARSQAATPPPLAAEAGKSRLVADCWQDARYASRLMIRSPAFALIAILTLALSIGATTAIFSIVHAVLLRPLPFAEPDRLVRLWETTPRGLHDNVVSSGNYLDWRERATAFEDIGAHSGVFGMGMTGTGEPARVEVAQITPSAVRMLGVPPLAGRGLTSADDDPSAPNIAVVSHAFWRQRFGGDRATVGRTITLDDRPYTVIGVMPPEFDFPSREVEVWLPLRFDAEDRQQRRSHNHLVIARLKPNVTVERAEAEMNALAAAIARVYPEHMTGWGVDVVPLRADLVEEVRPLLLALVAVVVVVLLVACANLANLLLARAAMRQHELAVRAALGASRGRMARQLLTESVILATIGGGLGVAVVVGTLDLILALAPADIPLLDDVRIDSVVLAVSAGVTLLSTVLFGVAPALRAATPDLRASLQAGRNRGGDLRNGRARAALVIAEVALSILLLTGAGLLTRSFWRLHQVAYGFEPAGVLAVNLNLPQSRYRDKPAQLAFYERMLERVRTLPGVAAAAGTTEPPVSGFNMTFSFAIQGRAARSPSGREDPVSVRAVTPGFFRAMGIPVVLGRALDDADRAHAPGVVLINQALAAAHWPEGDAVGNRISFQGPGGPWREVVGVVADTRHDGLDHPSAPAIYLPHAQKQENWQWMSWLTLMIRARPDFDAAALAPAVQAAVWELDDSLPIQRVTTLEQLYGENTARRRFAMLLFGAFAALALVLGSIGIYGVLSCSVAQRRHEIGIRMALGAARGQVAAAVVRQALLLAIVGVAAGAACAAALTRILASLLFGVTPTDPPTFAGVAALVLAVATLAAWIPARRAMRVDPLTALRAD